MMSTGLLAVLCLHCLAVAVWSSDDDNCGYNIDGGGWLLVRHTYNKWFQSTDSLVGTAEYGTDCGPVCDDEFSTPFSAENSTEFLFSSGDCDRWMITTYDQFVYQWGSNYPATILKSHISDVPYTAQWYSRGLLEDPWISYMDHGDEGGMTIMYGENSFGGNAAYSNSYMNVWMRSGDEATTTDEPSAAPSTEPTRASKDCSSFHIDDFLNDCSVEFEGHDTDIKGLQDDVSSVTVVAEDNAADIASLVAQFDDLSDGTDIKEMQEQIDAINERLSGYGDWAAAHAAQDPLLDNGLSGDWMAGKDGEGTEWTVVLTAKELVILGLVALTMVLITALFVMCSQPSGRRAVYDPVSVITESEQEKFGIRD